jgi:RluA family pseudouridine synthase
MSEVLFENDLLIAVNKPEGLAAIPEGAAGKSCLLWELEARLGHKLYVVHRLDKEVSGVILFAKDAATHKHLNDQFSSRQVYKSYLALAHGVINGAEGTIKAPLREFGSGRVGVDAHNGKPAQTDFTVRQRFKGYTLVAAHPITGRRHQLRVHFYSIGHPLVGDLRYGDRQVQQTFSRLMLHAERITFALPSGERVTVEAMLPTSFRQVIEMMLDK